MSDDDKVVSLDEVKLERTRSAINRLGDARSEGLYSRGEVYQRVLESKAYQEGGFADAMEWIASVDKSNNPVDYEWAAAVTRHYSREQVEPHGMTRMMYLLQYLQLHELPIPIGNPGLIVIRGPMLDGAFFEKRLDDVTIDEVQSVTRARLKALAQLDDHPIDDLPRGSDFDWPDELPAWLGLPQDHLAPLDEATLEKMANFEATLGPGTQVWCSMRGGERTWQFRVATAHVQQIVDAVIATAPKRPPELVLIKPSDEP